MTQAEIREFVAALAADKNAQMQVIDDQNKQGYSATWVEDDRSHEVQFVVHKLHGQINA